MSNVEDPIAALTETSKPDDDLLAGIRNGAWLDAQDFPPLRYAVPGLVPEGLSLMVGAPKIGKSWWTLDSCLAVSAGGYALGRIHTGTPRPVLYLALEDSDRRLQDRCRQLLDGAPIPPKFEYLLRVASPGAVAPTIATWLAWHRGEQPLCVVDTLGRAMPLASQGETVYQRDYRIMGDLKGLCDAELGASIVVNHHDRKAAADDFVDFVSGTNGLAGGADTVLVLSRDRGEQAGLLRVTGRDIAEGAYALTLVPGSWWRLDGANLEEAANAARSAKVSAGLGDKSAAILAYVHQHPEGVRADDVAAELDLQISVVRVYLQRLHDSQRVQRHHRGLYTPVISVMSVTSGEVGPSEHHTSNTNNSDLHARARGRPSTGRHPVTAARPCRRAGHIGHTVTGRAGVLMTAHSVLEPLIAAGLIARVSGDGRLTVYPEQAITPALDAHIRTHREELVAVLTTPAPQVQPLDWPPPEPAWFAAWMAQDDARRIATMAAATRRKTATKARLARR